MANVALAFVAFVSEMFAVTLPPVIDTLLAFCVDIVPKPVTAVLLIEIVTLLALVSLPCWSTVKEATFVASPYVPIVTAVLARDTVPVVVIGPPVRPVPVATLLT